MVDIASGTVVYGLQAFSAELSCRVFSLVLNSSTQEKKRQADFIRFTFSYTDVVFIGGFHCMPKKLSFPLMLIFIHHTMKAL